MLQDTYSIWHLLWLMRKIWPTSCGFWTNWEFMLFGVQQGVCLIPNRAAGIMRAVETCRELRLPLVFHRYCSRHVKVNFIQQFKSNHLAELMHVTVSIHQAGKFELLMSQIKEVGESNY